MTFSNRDKQKALAIVKIFETSKPVGRSDAVAVLNDGAGFSYGMSQFTDRSGSLDKVLVEYLNRGGTVGRSAIEEYLRASGPKTPKAISARASNAKTKRALQDAGKTELMKQVQVDMADKLYLNPSIKAAEGSGFVLPLSLAVIYDSKNHGSYDKIRDLVKISRKHYSSDVEFEKAWIYSYVKNRDAWLESIPRLAVTDYRTDFFLAQIARRNWNLDLPVTVHGVRLTEDVLLEDYSGSTGPNDPRNGPNIDPTLVEEDSASAPSEPSGGEIVTPEPSTQGSPAGAETNQTIFERVRSTTDQLGQKFDSVQGVVTNVTSRKDAAKSMWTTIGSTIWQSLWAVIAFIIGLPREVWLTVAIIAGAFMLYYLYRQITLGKLREQGAQALPAQLAQTTTPVLSEEDKARIAREYLASKI